jgi:hypothetical protein
MLTVSVVRRIAPSCPWLSVMFSLMPVIAGSATISLKYPACVQSMLTIVGVHRRLRCWVFFKGLKAATL